MGHYGFLALAFASCLTLAVSQPAQVTFEDCTSAATRSASNYDSNARINVSSVFAQIAYPNGQKTLRIRAIGETAEAVEPSATDPIRGVILSALFTKLSVLTFTVNTSQSWFCLTARPSSPLPPVNTTDNTYCPIPAGQLAWSADAPLDHDYNLTSIITRMRLIDPSNPGRELACIDVNTTPVRPGQEKSRNLGYPQAIFWLSVGLAAAYWVVIGAARISSAWSRGVASGPGWSSVRWAGTVFASAVSAERLSTHSALLRYATPSYRDILFHTQWCAALAMVAVQWPTFAYPILSNTAWAGLIYNITLALNPSPDLRWDPWTHNAYSPPSNFADQFSDSNSPLFLDNSVPNNLYTFPPGTEDGMESFAYAVGVRPQDLFGLCLKIWLIIVGVAIIVSVGIWFIDWFVSSCMGGRSGGGRSRGLRRGSMNDLTGYSGASDSGIMGGTASSDQHGKETGSDTAMLRGTDEEGGLAPRSHTPGTRGGLGEVRRHWWNYRLGQSSFHGSVLQGNLVRLLVLFHFPITIFSTYEFSKQMRSSPGVSSLALSALAFAFISVIIPGLLLAKLALTPTKKLYDATRTLLAFGPLYSHYAHGAQMFAAVVLGQSLAVGITVGAGQGSGTAQAIVLLVIEVASALATSIWLPWGERAGMGVMSFLYCVARIVTAVLLIILSPLVSVGDAAGGWIAYAIILIQGIVYAAFVLMLFIKILEGLVRLLGRVPFDKATHSMDSGLLGALSQAGCCGARRKKSSKARRGRNAKATGSVGTTTADLSGKQSPNLSLAGAGRPGMLYQQPGGSYRSTPSQVGQVSFLRPEQAFQPYREDADDENGYIMGAWAGSPTGYQPVANPTTPGVAAVADPGLGHPNGDTMKASGFSRVGGGRANFEDPFATLAPTAMSAAAQSRMGHTRQSSSTGTTNPGLPPGAMAPRSPQGAYNFSAPPSSTMGPHHTRVQSHPVIIESAGGALIPPRGGAAFDDDSSATGSSIVGNKKSGGGGGFWQRRVSSTPNERQDSYDDGDMPPVGARSTSAGGRGWFGRLIHRSEGDAPAGSSVPLEETGPSTFVVVRNNKKPITSSNPEPPRMSDEAGGDDGDDLAPKSSFVVVRPKRTSLPSSSALSPPDESKRSSA